MAFELATKVESVHASGQLAAVGWVTGVDPAPVTQREDTVTWALVRAESWVALCQAAQAEPPTARDWERLGVSPRPLVAGNADFAHGAWRTLAWLLGVHPEPPTELPLRSHGPYRRPPRRMRIGGFSSQTGGWLDSTRRAAVRPAAEPRLADIASCRGSAPRAQPG